MLKVYGWERSTPDFGDEIRTAVLEIGLHGIKNKLVCWRTFSFLLWFEGLGIAAGNVRAIEL